MTIFFLFSKEQSPAESGDHCSFWDHLLNLLDMKKRIYQRLRKKRQTN